MEKTTVAKVGVSGQFSGQFLGEAVGSRQSQDSFRTVFRRSSWVRTVSGQFQDSFTTISGQFHDSFRTVSRQNSFKTVSKQFLLREQFHNRILFGGNLLKFFLNRHLKELND